MRAVKGTLATPLKKGMGNWKGLAFHTSMAEFTYRRCISFQTRRIECPGFSRSQGEIDLKDGMNRALSLTMLMEGEWREIYKMVKEKKMAVHR
jgi:hypothetical protein